MVAFLKMLVCEQINVLDGVDISNSKECMFCHYWCYLDKDFTYGPYHLYLNNTSNDKTYSNICRKNIITLKLYFHVVFIIF